jgi:hypothetical protein
MYCPNCSTEASTEQKFCRSCGMELQPVADLIRDQSPMVKVQSHHEPTVEARPRAMVIWGFTMMFGAAAVGVSLKLLGKEGIRPFGEFTPYVSVIAVVAAIFGMGLMCYPFLAQTWGKPNSQERALPKSGPTIKLRPALLSDEQPSITEQTTELLEASEVRINVRDTAPQNE